jgi:hypothetical protein
MAFSYLTDPPSVNAGVKTIRPKHRCNDFPRALDTPAPMEWRILRPVNQAGDGAYPAGAAQYVCGQACTAALRCTD